ncbi:hypothetical protein HDF26_004582 [Pedobacter cryoconitis]|uniref:Uncharacterized protein n=1 Tax=Pedobacter cryoconitis TaxID=188932 RepID=A0A7W8ZJN2_9SPHI|nr:hypothetical protein [Pedobacter cryoconitis]MBB6274109.1 hypothetical protein [Pedobacter cryoconitis]
MIMASPDIVFNGFGIATYKRSKEIYLSRQGYLSDLELVFPGT